MYFDLLVATFAFSQSTKTYNFGYDVFNYVSVENRKRLIIRKYIIRQVKQYLI